MADVEYIHICDYAFLSNGKPSFIGVFDHLGGPAFPLTQPLFSVAAQFRGKPHEVINFKIQLTRPNGDVIASTEGQLTAGDEGWAFVHAGMLNTTFPEPGRYSVKIISGGQTLKSQHLHLSKVSAPATVPPKPAGPFH